MISESIMRHLPAIMVDVLMTLYDQEDTANNNVTARYVSHCVIPNEPATRNAPPPLGEDLCKIPFFTTEYIFMIFLCQCTAGFQILYCITSVAQI